MNSYIVTVFVIVFWSDILCPVRCQDNKDKGVSTWKETFRMYPTMATWSLQTKIPMTSDFDATSRQVEGRKKKYKKKLQKFMLPLLLAYKLKYFTLIPVMIGGLVLLVGATGMAGFFFALFAAVMGLKTGH